jgi:hypothetical protein
LLELVCVPHKLNAKGRRHIPRAKYGVRNWRTYNEALRNRGSLTIWISPEALAAWRAPRRTTRGGQTIYSDLAIEMMLSLRVVFGLALRQTEGLLISVLQLLKVDLAVPDYSTLSRRAAGLEVQPWPGQGGEAVHLIVDSTGLRLRGAAEWEIEKHGTTRRRSWSKLHIGLNPDTGEILCFDLTARDMDDAGHVESLLGQVSETITSFMGDGAYVGDPVRRVVERHSPGARFVAPPRKDAVLSPSATTAPSQRDRDIQHIDRHGRMAWQKASGYNIRSLVEAEMSRYKRVMGDGLRSRQDGRRLTEVKIKVKCLNRMARLGRPDSVRVA